jgi:hypothetical protein
MNFDPVEIHSGRDVSPGAAKQVHAMSERNYSLEDFSQMKLGATCLRIFVVLPIQYEYPH